MKRRIKGENYKIHSSTIKIISFIVILFIFKIIILICSKNIDGFAYCYLINIHNPFNTFLFRLFQYTPLIGNYISVILSIASSIFCFIVAILISIKTVKVKTKERVFNYFLVIVTSVCAITFMSLMNDNVLLNTEFLDKLYMSDKVDSDYTVDDLILLDTYFKEKVLYYSESVERENNKVYFNEDITKSSVNSLKNISNEFEFLKGKYPSKIRDFTNTFRKYNNDGTVGFTMGYGIAMDYTFEKVNLIMTSTHELCHMKGLIRENETVFCQTIANISYDNDVVKYAGYLEAFNRTTYALRKIAPNTANEIGDEVERLCLTDNYEEICQLHRKDIYNYIKGSDELFITTYSLLDYKDYKTQFYKFIDILINDYNAIILNENNDEISYNELMYNIDNDDNDYVVIKINIDETTYNNLYQTLNDYSHYYMSLYQHDSSEEEEEEKTVEEAIDYYINPFNDNKKYFYNRSKLIDDYDYERVTRLYLEYFDKYGY